MLLRQAGLSDSPVAVKNDSVFSIPEGRADGSAHEDVGATTDRVEDGEDFPTEAWR